MAERRMFAKGVVSSDAFLDLPLSAQALYFHLAMQADDDGFVGAPRKVQRSIEAAPADLDWLEQSGFILRFPSGIVAIRHWKISNYIQNDRYHPSIYTEEKSRISCQGNQPYELMDTGCIQVVSNLDTQVRLGKVSLGEDSLGEYRSGKESGGEESRDQFRPGEWRPDEESKDEGRRAPGAAAPSPSGKAPPMERHGEYGWIRLTGEQYERLLAELGRTELERCITYLDESAQQSGNKNRWKDWNLLIRRCHREGWGLRGGARPGAAPPPPAGEQSYDLTGLEDRLLLDFMEHGVV